MSDRPFTPRKPRFQRSAGRPGRRENQPRRQFGDPDVIVLYGWHPVAEALRNRKRAFRRLLATENSARRLARGTRRAPADRTGDRPPGRDQPSGRARRRPPGPLSRGRSPALADPRNPERNAGRPRPRPDHRPAQCGRHRADARRPSASKPSSRPRAIRRPPRACWRNPPPAGSNMCPSWSCATCPTRLWHSARKAFQRIGLDSSGDLPLDEIPLRQPVVLVLGSEGKGLRQRTRDCCDAIGRLDMPGAIKSLNVSNAAAISLFAVTKAVAPK